MVEFGSGPVKEHIDNTVFVVPGIIIVVLVEERSKEQIKTKREREREGRKTIKMDIRNLEEEILEGRGQQQMNSLVFSIYATISGVFIAFFTYKLVSSLRQKQKAKDDKKKQKQQKKDKETHRKQKKK